VFNKHIKQNITIEGAGDAVAKTRVEPGYEAAANRRFDTA